MIKRLANKKYVLYILVLLVVVTIGISYAIYFSDDTFMNEFKTMTYNVNIEEEFDSTWGKKKVYFSNDDTTNVGVVLRINYNESWTKNADGIFMTLSNKINNTDVATKGWTTTFLNDFQLADDGWYYYKKVLNAGDRIQVLENVNLNSEIIGTLPYNNYDYELDFNYEAIQASSNAISEIWSKNATINGGNVTWQ